MELRWEPRLPKISKRLFVLELRQAVNTESKSMDPTLHPYEG